ncbi:MAG: hypothetical protein AAGC72_01180 [Planctomycetota bacterium]
MTRPATLNITVTDPAGSQTVNYNSTFKFYQGVSGSFSSVAYIPEGGDPDNPTGWAALIYGSSGIEAIYKRTGGTLSDPVGNLAEQGGTATGSALEP